MSMNDPEVTMLDTLPNSNLIAYDKALEAAGIALACGARRKADTNSSESGQHSEGKRTVIRTKADTFAVWS